MTKPIDRTGWGPGPWDGEADDLAWTDDATGLPCCARRNRLGGWCGYVGVPPGHPWHGKDYSEEALCRVEVHGGLTFADALPVEPAGAWWLGFDCSHAWDVTPGLGIGALAYPWRGREEVYRDEAYVRAETTSLAAQVAAAKGFEPISDEVRAEVRKTVVP